MLNEVIKGISMALNTAFGDEYEIRQNDVEQGLVNGSFFIQVLKPELTPLLGRRSMKRNHFDVMYFPKAPGNNAEMFTVAEKLMECLTQIGEGIDSKVSGLFDGSAMDSMGAFDIGNTLDGIYGNTGDTAGNTAAMSDALDITEEDLSYLRDIAEREAINRFTTAEIHVEQHNENHISKDADLDGIMDAWANDFAEKLDVSEEGVHE